MSGLDRVVVFAVGLSAASAGLAMYAASPGLQYLRANVEQRQEQELLERIAEDADRLGRSVALDLAADPSADDAQGIREIHQAVSDVRQAVARLRDRPGDGRSVTLDLQDIEEVLRCCGSIDHVTRRHQLGADAEGLWLALRADVGRLAPRGRGPTSRSVAPRP
jgi:hypothetical protein